MSSSRLTAFWIDGPDPGGSLGFGVTAFSLQDALEIIRRAGYQLPEETGVLRVRSEIKHGEIQEQFVREHMGPIAVRGLWYPFVEIGYGA